METYYGVVRSPADAIKLFEACRLGLLPRVQRRLSEKERQAIRSGSVFVWDEREAGMRRWTDGKSWSASRVAGSFLTYREMEGKRGNAFGGRRGAGKTPDSGRGSDEDHDDGEPDGYRYKPDGLTKQSFSITNAAGQHLHLIAYYARGPLDLPLPTTDPTLRHIIPAKGMYPESSLTETTPPTTGRAPLPQPTYMPPPHQPQPPHAYPPHYPYPGHAWPPSPDGTPPYSHGQYSYPPALPPPQGHHPPPALPPYPPPPPSHHHPQHHYPPAESNSSQERAPLPLPPPPSYSSQHAPAHPSTPSYSHAQPHSQPQLPAPRPAIQAPPPYPQNQHQSPQLTPRVTVLDSPRSQHLQAKAREAVQIEPRLAPIDAARNQHSPLPAPGQLTHSQQNGGSPTTVTTATSTTTTAATTPITLPPPTTAASPTIKAPSGSPISNGISRPDSSGRAHAPTTTTPTTASTRPTLSALLHPSTIPPPIPHGNSEPGSGQPISAGAIGSGSAGISSAGSSPSAALPPSTAVRQDSRSSDEDARAIGVLNKHFF
ncbi:hypothetical protein VTH82DRAFT_6407 [Thermothelomyces myriococcoides]